MFMKIDIGIDYSFVFTELLPFQLVPQILTSYNPVALKMVVFLIFILNILTLAYLVWFVSGRTVAALLFCALAAVIPREGYFWLAEPTTHNATILFGGVILILLFTLCHSLEAQKKTSRKTRKNKVPETPAVPWSYALVLVALVFLSVFSDTIILVWVLVPFVLAYIAFFRREHNELDLVTGAVTITAIIAYILKTYAVSDWIRYDYTVHSIGEIFTGTIPLFFKALFLFLNPGLIRFSEEGFSVGLAEVLLSVLFIMVILWSVWSGWVGRNTNNPERQLFLGVLLISIILTTAAFLISGYAQDLFSARYLAFTALAILMLVAISCPVSENICMVSVLLLLIVSATAGSISLSTLDTSPNARELGLIADLKDQKLSFGYGTYWNSNVVTYLSGEDVTVRSTYIAPDDLLPDRLNSCNSWYTSRPDRFFLIYDATRPTLEAQKNYPLLKKTVNTSDVLHYRDFEVFLFHPT